MVSACGMQWVDTLRVRMVLFQHNRREDPTVGCHDRRTRVVARAVSQVSNVPLDTKYDSRTRSRGKAPNAGAEPTSGPQRRPHPARPFLWRWYIG